MYDNSISDHPVEIPASKYADGNTYYAPVTATGAKVTEITSKKTEPANWVDDLLQVTNGPGSTGYTTVLPAHRQHKCPICVSDSTAKLLHVPNCAYWGEDVSCECGADYSSEEIGWEEYADITTFSINWLRERHTPEVLEQHRKDFAYWLKRAVPEGAKPVYSDDYIELLGVELPDGQRVMR